MTARREDRVHELEREVQTLYEVNAKLVAQLEAQYKQMISVADTIQSVHVARIHDAMVEVSTDSAANIHRDFKMDFDTRSSSADEQLRSLTVSSPSTVAKEQAMALRQLEDRVRTWAKKFLHKVKAAASAAESRMYEGDESLAPVSASIPSVRVTREHRRDSSPVDSSHFVTVHGGPQSIGNDGSVPPLHAHLRTRTSEEPSEDIYGQSQGVSTPGTEGSRDKKKKKMFFNRLFSGRK